MADQNVGIRISGDASGAVAAAQAAGQAQKALGEEFRRGSQATKEQAEEARQFVERLKEEADALGRTRIEQERLRAEQLKLTDAQKRQVESSLEAVEAHKRQEGALQALKIGIATVAAAAATFVAGNVAYAKSFIDSADNVYKLSQSLAISTEGLTAFQYGAQLAGVSNDQLSTSVRNLARNMAEANAGTGDGAKLFRALGTDLELAVKGGQSIEQLLPQIADAFQRLPDGATKTTLAIQTFGRGGERLIPLLNGGAAGLRDMAEEAREFGLVISGSTARNAEVFNDNITRINASLTAGKRALVEEYLPGLVRVSEQLVAGTRIAGGFANAIMLIGSSSPFGSTHDNLTALRARAATLRERQDTGGWQGASPFAGFGVSPERPVGQQLDRTERLLEWYKFLERQEALERTSGMDTGDAVSRRALSGQLARERGAQAALAKEPKKESGAVDEYERLIAQIERKAAAEEREIALGRSLTEVERQQVQVYEQLAMSKRAYTHEELLAIDAALQRALAGERASRGLELQRKAEEESAKAYAQYLAEQKRGAQVAEEANRKLAEQNEQIGLTAEQLAALKVRRAEEAAATERQREAWLQANEAGEQELEIARERVKQAEEFVRLTREGTQRSVAVEQAKEARAEWQRTNDHIQRSLTDALMRGFDKGKTFAENLRDAVVNMFKTMVLEPVIRPVVGAMAGAVTNMLMPGVANAASGAMGFSPTSLLNFGDVGGGLYGLLGGSSMASVNASAAAAMGGGLEAAGLASGMGAGFAGALPWLGAGALALGIFGGDLFGGGGGPKSQSLTLMRDPGSGRFWNVAENVNGNAEAMLGARLPWGVLNDPSKYDQGVLASLVGQTVSGGPGESGEAVVARFLAHLAPAAQEANRRAAEEAQRAAEEARRAAEETRRAAEEAQRAAEAAAAAERERTRALLEQVQGTLALREASRDFLREVQGLNLDSVSPLTARERLDFARAQYSTRLDEARAGDPEALGMLSGGLQDYLREASSFYGRSTPTYRAIFDAGQADAGALVGSLTATWSTQIADAFRQASEKQTREIVAAIKDQGVNIERGVAGVLEAMARA